MASARQALSSPLAASASASTSAADSSSARADAAVLENEVARLSKYMTPFAEEIAPYLKRLQNMPRAPALPKVEGGPAAVLNSPESFGAFLDVRAGFVSAIQDITELQSLVRARVELLAAFNDEQQRMFDELETDLVRARATQAALQQQIDLHAQMYEQLVQSARGLQAAVSTQLHVLSPAEEAFHAQLASLRDGLIPQLHDKIAELSQKEAHIEQVQRELQQAQRASARKGLATPDSKSAWSAQQLAAIKPVLTNQSTAISALVAQMT